VFLIGIVIAYEFYSEPNYVINIMALIIFLFFLEKGKI